MTAQLLALFSFGLVVTFIVFLGIQSAKEFQARESRSAAARERGPAAPPPSGMNLGV